MQVTSCSRSEHLEQVGAQLAPGKGTSPESNRASPLQLQALIAGRGPPLVCSRTPVRAGRATGERLASDRIAAGKGPASSWQTAGERLAVVLVPVEHSTARLS